MFSLKIEVGQPLQNGGGRRALSGFWFHLIHQYTYTRTVDAMDYTKTSRPLAHQQPCLT